ncbi:hypothetical protein LX77_01709 [Gelidibacter algens]|jgi:hypothetical protein|uniref:Tellurite resistance protein TerB n=1 Tax=Gelidibacter algens TaxID=49280 RepID=A0A1A7R3P1_9FLAO|nr:hypothetical protein [Gelidibacter algens]OBX25392.1 hypothetical protein A9996_10070 [Gelidibacter algens]RAJ24713.1 hypothetical protein LX77_01709 [Gelidibacter algens]
MKTKKQMTLKFYQNLGKLFYAIAAADHKVLEAEISKLKEVVKKEWLAIDDLQDQFGTDAAYQIEVVFDQLYSDGKLNVKTCYDDFVTYKNDQKHLFTKQVKQLILKTANAIAESFSGKNKSELILLAKLNIELNKE